MLSTAILLLAGCASIEKNKPDNKTESIPKSVGLQMQALKPGECGLFFWTQTLPRTFVFFDNFSTPDAKLFWRENEIPLFGQDAHDGSAYTSNFDILYNKGGSGTVRVKGEKIEELEGGVRVGNASITVRELDGWQEIMPVSGVHVCR